MQLEFPLPGVRARNDAVQRIPRVPAQICCLCRPHHRTHEQVSVRHVGLDGANARRSVRAYGAQHRHARTVQTCRAEPGNLRGAHFQVTPVERVHCTAHGTDVTRHSTLISAAAAWLDNRCSSRMLWRPYLAVVFVVAVNNEHVPGTTSTNTTVRSGRTAMSTLDIQP